MFLRNRILVESGKMFLRIRILIESGKIVRIRIMIVTTLLRIQDFKIHWIEFKWNLRFRSGFPLLSFRRKMVKWFPPPESNFGQAIPPEPEKLARYLVVGTQKNAKNKGSKKFYPLKTRFLDDSRGVSGKFFLNLKFLEKSIFIAF